MLLKWNLRLLEKMPLKLKNSPWMKLSLSFIKCFSSFQFCGMIEYWLYVFVSLYYFFFVVIQCFLFFFSNVWLQLGGQSVAWQQCLLHALYSYIAFGHRYALLNYALHSLNKPGWILQLITWGAIWWPLLSTISELRNQTILFRNWVLPVC